MLPLIFLWFDEELNLNHSNFRTALSQNWPWTVQLSAADAASSSLLRSGSNAGSMSSFSQKDGWEADLQRGGWGRKDMGNVILRLRNMIPLSHHQRRGFNQLSRVKLDNASMRGMNWTCANSLEDFFFLNELWCKKWCFWRIETQVVIWYRLIFISTDAMDEFYLLFFFLHSSTVFQWFCFVRCCDSK